MFYLVIISNTASFIIPETQNNIEKTIENIGFIFHIVYFTLETCKLISQQEPLIEPFPCSMTNKQSMSTFTDLTLIPCSVLMQASSEAVTVYMAAKFMLCSHGTSHIHLFYYLGLCGFLSLLLFLRRKLSRKVVGLLGVLLDLVVVHFLAPLVLLHDPLQLVLREVTLQPEPRPHYCRRCRCAVRL